MPHVQIAQEIAAPRAQKNHAPPGKKRHAQCISSSIPSAPNAPLIPNIQPTKREPFPDQRHACQWQSSTITIAKYSGRFLVKVPKTPSYCAGTTRH